MAEGASMGGQTETTIGEKSGQIFKSLWEMLDRFELPNGEKGKKPGVRPA